MKRSLASSRILLWIFASLSLASATNVDNALRYRQIVPKGTGASASPTSVLSVPASSKTPESIISSTPASDTPESSLATSNTPNLVSTSTPSTVEEEPSSTLVSSDTPDARSSTVEIQSATDAISSSEGPSTTPGPVSPASTKPVSSITQVVVITSVFVTGGTSVTSTVRSTGVVAAPGSAVTSKGAPKLDGNTDDSGSSGMKPSDRRVIIGTVVGIGGAILLGGIAVVVWRVWGKRRYSTDDDRDLMDSQPGSSGREKRSSVSGNDPFRSTLDQYHNPAGPVNTASNF